MTRSRYARREVLGRAVTPPRPGRSGPPGLEGAVGRGVLLLHLALSPLLFSVCTLEAFEYPKATLLLLTAIVLGALGLSALLGHLAGAPPSRWLPLLRDQAAGVCRP